MSKSGRIFVFDGPDGVGKTTQIELTKEFLESEGHEVFVIRASGGTAIGQKLREVSLSDTERPPEVDVYISLAMHTAVGKEIQKQKAAGKICLVDRSPMAVIAYNLHGSQLADEKLAINAFNTLMELWSPDAIFYINAGQDIVEERREDRQKASDYFEKQGHQYHMRVRTGYEHAIQLLQKSSFASSLISIDGSPAVKEVQDSIQEKLKNLLS